MPVSKDGLWVFGGGLKRPKLLIEAGSPWSWLHYGERVFDSAGLSQTDATLSLLRFDSESFRISEINCRRGEHLTIYTHGHSAIEFIKPLRVRIIREGKVIYEDRQSPQNL